MRQAPCGREELPDDWESTAEVVKETATKMFVLSAGQRKKGHLMVREKKNVDSCILGIQQREVTKENSELYAMLKTKEKESSSLKRCAASLGTKQQKSFRLVQHMCECRVH